jgi:hypothetical protein
MTFRRERGERETERDENMEFEAQLTKRTSLIVPISIPTDVLLFVSNVMFIHVKNLFLE